MTAPNEEQPSDQELPEFLRAQEPNEIEELRKWIRRQYALGLPREEIVDDLVQRGHEERYVEGLVDSVYRSASTQYDGPKGVEWHPGGKSPYLTKPLTNFDESALSQKRRREQRRKQRERREMQGGTADAPAPELAFEESPTLTNTMLRKQKGGFRKVILAIAIVLVGVAALVGLVLMLQH